MPLAPRSHKNSYRGLNLISEPPFSSSVSFSSHKSLVAFFTPLKQTTKW